MNRVSDYNDGVCCSQLYIIYHIIKFQNHIRIKKNQASKKRRRSTRVKKPPKRFCEEFNY